MARMRKQLKKKINRKINVLIGVLIVGVLFLLCYLITNNHELQDNGDSNDEYIAWEKSIYGDNYVFGAGPELVYETQSYGLGTIKAWFNPYEVYGGLIVKYANGENRMLFEGKGAKQGFEEEDYSICIYNALIIDDNDINISSNYIPTFTLGMSKDGQGNYMKESKYYDMCGAIKWFPFSSEIVDIINEDAYKSLNERNLSATWKFDRYDKFAKYTYKYSITGDEVRDKYNKFVDWFQNIESIRFVYQDKIPKEYDYIGRVPYSNGLVCVQQGKKLTIIAKDRNKKIYLSKDASNLFSCVTLDTKYILQNCMIDMENVDCSLVEDGADMFYGCEDSVKNFNCGEFKEQRSRRVVKLFEQFLEKHNINTIFDKEIEIVNNFFEEYSEELVDIDYDEIKLLLKTIIDMKEYNIGYDEKEDLNIKEKCNIKYDMNEPLGTTVKVVNRIVDKGREFALASIDELKEGLGFDIVGYKFMGWNTSGETEDIMVGKERRLMVAPIYTFEGVEVKEYNEEKKKEIEVEVPIWNRVLKVEFEEGETVIANNDVIYKAVWRPAVNVILEDEDLGVMALGETCHLHMRHDREHSRIIGFEDMDGNMYKKDEDILLYKRMNEISSSLITFKPIWEREYITELMVAYGVAGGGSPIERLKNAGYIVIEQDLNEGANPFDVFGITKVYLGYKTDWLEEGRETTGFDRYGRETVKAITSLWVKKSHDVSVDTSWRGFEIVKVLGTEEPANLDIGKQYARLYCDRSGNRDGIIDIIPHKFNESGHGKWIMYPVNVFCEYDPSTNYLDINKSTGGKYIYLEQVY